MAEPYPVKIVRGPTADRKFTKFNHKVNPLFGVICCDEHCSKHAEVHAHIPAQRVFPNGDDPDGQV